MSYKIRFTGRITDEFNPHEFDCTFDFPTKAQAKAFYDFKLVQKREKDVPDEELVLVEKLFDQKES